MLINIPKFFIPKNQNSLSPFTLFGEHSTRTLADVLKMERDGKLVLAGASMDERIDHLGRGQTTVRVRIRPHFWNIVHSHPAYLPFSLSHPVTPVFVIKPCCRLKDRNIQIY